MRIEHTIFLEEKKGFAKKYMRFIQKVIFLLLSEGS